MIGGCVGFAHRAALAPHPARADADRNFSYFWIELARHQILHTVSWRLRLGSFRVGRAISAGADQWADVVRFRDASETVVENIAGDPLGDVEGCIQNPALRRVDQPCREVLLGDLLSDRLR